MSAKKGDGLAERIVAAEEDLFRDNIEGIMKSIQKMVDKDDPDMLKCVVRRIKSATSRIAELSLVKEQAAAGEFRPVLFYIMERMHESEYVAGMRRLAGNLQEIAEDLKGRVVHYKRAVEYGKIAHELMDLMEAK